MEEPNKDILYVILKTINLRARIISDINKIYLILMCDFKVDFVEIVKIPSILEV